METKTITKQQIEKGNSSIAKFMGYTQDEFGAIMAPSFPKIPLVYISNLKYHEDWNFLMPVLKKIAKINDTYKTGVESTLSENNFEILPVWIAVVKHIKLTT